MRALAFGAVLTFVASAVACGRVGPGATLAARQDPFPPAIVPTLAVGRRIAASGEDPGGAHWAEAHVSLAYHPPWDHVSPYVAAGVVWIGGQDDLSGPAGTGGLMLALSSRVILEGHGRLVRSDADARDDVVVPPDDPVRNKASAIILGATYGRVPW